MKRRQFIALIGGAAAWPVVAQGQQTAMPVIGFLHAGSAEPTTSYVRAFRQALAEVGYVENHNVAIEYRYAEGEYDQLPEMASALIQRQVVLIVAAPNENAARAAKAAAGAIPVLFIVSDDPTKLGLVASLNRPGGNATGVNFVISELVGKRLGLLRELLPDAARVAALVNPSAASTEAFVRDLTASASTIGISLDIVPARDRHEIEEAFATFSGNKVNALMVAPDTFFANSRLHIVELATRYAIPAIYTVRSYVDGGGLVSYGPSQETSYRQLGIYAGRILKGEKPADLPVVQSSKLDLIINLRTAKELSLVVPPTFLARVDEVIE